MRQVRAIVATLLGANLIFSSPVTAQSDGPLPGGATAATAFCVQAGDIANGAFSATFLQTGPKSWEEKAYARVGRFRFEETRRDDAVLELVDRSRNVIIQMDFNARKIRTARTNSSDPGRDAFHILNATDRIGSTDCAALAELSGVAPPANTGGGGSSAGGGGDGGSVTVVNVFVRPGTFISIPPGTPITAVTGPPCPGNPGYFLCPNKFSCAPIGGVCCPGAGACNPGRFCDKFIATACIGPPNPRFCAGTGDPTTGLSLHCAPGKVCMPGNICL
jgi:hypothetical protein